MTSSWWDIEKWLIVDGFSELQTFILQRRLTRTTGCVSTHSIDYTFQLQYGWRFSPDGWAVDVVYITSRISSRSAASCRITSLVVCIGYVEGNPRRKPLPGVAGEMHMISVAGWPTLTPVLLRWMTWLFAWAADVFAHGWAIRSQAEFVQQIEASSFVRESSSGALIGISLCDFVI